MSSSHLCMYLYIMFTYNYSYTPQVLSHDRYSQTRAMKSCHRVIQMKLWIMAPPWGLSTPKAPKELFPHLLKVMWSRNMVFLTDLHHILHEWSCNNSHWFPHTPMPPGPLIRPQN